MPGTGDASQHVELRDVFDFGDRILFWIVAKNNTLDPILRAADPRFLQVLQDGLHARPRACYEASIRDRDGKGPS